MKNECPTYPYEERRQHCELVIALRSQYLEDKKDRDEWRKSVEKKLDDLQESLTPVVMAFKGSKWFFISLGGAIIIAAGVSLWNWLLRKIL